MKKKRILFLSEASFLGSGYGVVAKELLVRFHRSKEYDIAELACYASPENSQIKDIPWRVYPNMPSEKNEDEKKNYHSNPFNQFGLWKWESVCLDFEPDVVCMYRDHWYDKFVLYSPLRRFYKTIWSPTIDAYPLNKEWISDYTLIDACLTYTKWGASILKEQCKDKINFCGVATPGANIDNFYPIAQKEEVKKQFGIEDDRIIIGFTARNQIRKLFPELLENFVILLNQLPKEIADKTYLYFHTTYPDSGWDFPNLLKEFGLATKVYFTYYCKNCQHIFGSFYKDLYTFCQKCKNFSASIPSGPQNLISPKFINYIYNIFDIYVQFANCEGLGIPAMEAGAAGIPLMVVNYSGMCDYVTETGAIPIKSSTYKMDIHTGRFMSIPDKDDFIEKLKNLILMPSTIRRSIGFKIREKIKNKYTWDHCFNIWKQTVDNLPPNVYKWRENKSYFLNIPGFNEKPELNNDQYISWLIHDVFNRPDLMKSYLKLKLLKDLNWRKQKISDFGMIWSEECIMNHISKYKENIGRKEIFEEILKLVYYHNEWEKNRISKFK